MVYTYSAVVQTNFTANTDQIAIEITAPAGTTVKIKKIRVMDGDGTNTLVPDYYRKVKLVTESVAGSGGVSYTPIRVNANQPASVCTVNINSGAFVPGTILKTIDILTIHSNSDFIMHAREDDDKIVILPAGIFAVIVNPAN